MQKITISSVSSIGDMSTHLPFYKSMRKKRHVKIMSFNGFVKKENDLWTESIFYYFLSQAS